MSETIYLEDPSARIGNAWFVFRGRSYRVQDVHSVSTRRLWSNRGLLSAAIVLPNRWSAGNSRDPNRGLFSALAIAGMFLWIVAFFIKDRRRAPMAHLVELRGTFGRVNAFVILDEAYAKMIVDTIEPPRKRRASRKGTTSGPVSN